jgi:DnaA-homolog protein
MSMQFALPLMLDDQPSLSNFIGAHNQEVLVQCEMIAFGNFEHTALYLWGASGAGKSHLVRSLSALPNSVLLDFESLNRACATQLNTHIYLLESVEQLTPTQQVNLFHLYNQIRSQGKTLVLTANCPVAQLPHSFLPDLKTRLSWDLVYQLEPLTDDDKAQVLISQAEQRGLTLGSGVVTYMLHHLSRDLSQLRRFLLHLDAYSLQQKRAVTLPLLKEWLNHDSNDSNSL